MNVIQGKNTEMVLFQNLFLSIIPFQGQWYFWMVNILGIQYPKGISLFSAKIQRIYSV